MYRKRLGRTHGTNVDSRLTSREFPLSVLVVRGSDYARLRRSITAAHLLDRTPWRYAARTALTLGFFGATWWVLCLLGSSWFALVIAGAMGLASTQIAFLGHDGGHRQVTAKRLGNDLLGLLAANLLTGLSIGWWLDKHNRHHANPNKEGHDPDIGEGVLAFTVEQAASRRGPLAAAVTRHQAALFFPLITFEGWNLHVASVRFLTLTPPTRWRATETALLGFHIAAYLSALFLLLPATHAVAFIAVHQAVFGFYMGCSFAPNHKGMPIIAADATVDYLRRQVLTSRNIRGGWFVDNLLGGLNYQIEHHLFPSMPRANFRRAQHLVRAHCDSLDISYADSGLRQSYAITLGYLHELGRPLRAPARQS